MAGRGPAPKAQHARARDTARRVAPKVEVVEDGQVHGPDLPDGLDWPSTTRTWWENWRRSAQGGSMTVTDWDFMLDTALLHARFWSGETGVAGELRLRLAKFGATIEDRQRLRMQLEQDKPTQAAADKPKASRYAHLRIAE